MSLINRDEVSYIPPPNLDDQAGAIGWSFSSSGIPLTPTIPSNSPYSTSPPVGSEHGGDSGLQSSTPYVLDRKMIASIYRPAAPPPLSPRVTPATLKVAVGAQQRRRGKLPKPVTEFLKTWLFAHTNRPYPTEDEKEWLCAKTGLSMNQVSNWMSTARRRLLAPAAADRAAAEGAMTSSTSEAAALSHHRSPPIRNVSGLPGSNDMGGTVPLAGVGPSFSGDEMLRERDDESLNAEQEQDGRSSSILENLMTTHKPLDITGQAVIPDYRRQAHGGLAVVYPGLWGDTRVAIKVFKFRKHGGADAYWDMSNERRIKREMHVWAALKHPNIIEFLGYSTDLSDYPAMISSWCQRGTVLEHLRRHPLSVNKRMNLAQDISHGLEYLHHLKVIHGDVKPANILVDDDGVAKLCDFGLVRLADWEGPAGMTTTSAYTGTERYKAPELFISPENRQPVATFEGDIYSLGCIMLEVVEGIYPFQRFTKTYELRSAIMDGYSPALRPETTHVLLDMTESFWNLLEACWSQPSDRPGIQVIVEALDDFARTMPSHP